MSAAAIAVRASDQPAYNEDVVRLFTIATMFWGVVGFAAGTFIAFQLAYPVAQSRAGMDDLRPPAPAAHLGGDLRLRRQRAPRHLALGGAADLPRHAVRRTAAREFPVLGLPAVHRHGGPRLRARHHPGPRIRRAGMVRRLVADPGLGRLSRRLLRHDAASARSRTSTSPTGSTSPSSSPSRCCTSSTTWRCRCRSSA